MCFDADDDDDDIYFARCVFDGEYACLNTIAIDVTVHIVFTAFFCANFVIYSKNREIERKKNHQKEEKKKSCIIKEIMQKPQRKYEWAHTAQNEDRRKKKASDKLFFLWMWKI